MYAQLICILQILTIIKLIKQQQLYQQMLAIEGDHIMSLIVGFLKRYGEEELAELVSDKIVNPKALKNVPLAKKKLEKIIQNYVLQDKNLVKYYEENAEQESQEEQQCNVQPKKRKRTASHSKQMREQSDNNEEEIKQTEKNNGIYSKFSKPKLLETTVDKDNEEDEGKHKKEKKSKKQEKVKVVEKKVKKQLSSESEESQQQEVKSKPLPKSTKKQKVVKQIQKQSEQEQQQKYQKKLISKPKHIQQPKVNNYSTYDTGYQKTEKKFFSRIDASKIGPLPEKLRDNTFEAKFKFGEGGDDWGKYGNEKLRNERGDGFKKMKGKLKNKSFQGGTIDPYKVNSISLL